MSKTKLNALERFIKSSEDKGDKVRFISGDELQEITDRINHKVNQKVKPIQFMEKQMRVKSASWIMK